METANHPATYVIATIAVIGAVLRIGLWVGSVNEHKTIVTKFMKELRDKLDQIFLRLPAETVGGISPFTLTDLGKRISEELSAKDWAARIAPDLRASVTGKEPYEIRDFCYVYVRDTLVVSETQEAEIRRSAYENGVDRVQVLNVLAIELRDRLLEDS